MIAAQLFTPREPIVPLEICAMHELAIDSACRVSVPLQKTYGWDFVGHMGNRGNPALIHTQIAEAYT